MALIEAQNCFHHVHLLVLDDYELLRLPRLRCAESNAGKEVRFYAYLFGDGDASALFGEGPAAGSGSLPPRLLYSAFKVCLVAAALYEELFIHGCALICSIVGRSLPL